MEEFKRSVTAESEEFKRSYQAEQKYNSVERALKDKVAKGSAYTQELIKSNILKNYKIDGDKILDPSTNTTAKFPGEDRLIESLEEIVLHEYKKANIVAVSNAGRTPEHLDESGRKKIATSTISKGASDQLKRLAEMRGASGM